jgi:AraC family transcriptional regulator, transcriptional activator of pobA
MEFSFYDKVNGGILHLLSDGSLKGWNYFREKRKVSFYTIVFNTSAIDATIEIDNIRYCFPAFSLIPIMFNQSYCFAKTDGLVMWQFNREFYCIVNHDKEVGCAGFLFYGSWGQLVLETTGEVRNKILLLLEVFKDEFEDRDDIQGNMLRMLLVRLIITITRMAREKYLPAGEKTDIRFDLLRQFNLLVERNFRAEHEVQFYAAALYKSPKTLANTFSRFHSVSPLQIIHQRLILEAKRLLYYTNKSIKEISADLGFEDAAHFTKFFKNHLKMSPSEFKKSAAAV